MSSMWTVFKHIALEWLIPLQESQVHGTEFLQQLFLLGLVIVPSYCSHSSLDFPSRIFLSLPHHWLILYLSKSLNTWIWKGHQEVIWSRAAHSRAKSQCKVAHCSLEKLQGCLASTQKSESVVLVQGGDSQPAWWGNTASDGLPIPVRTSWPSQESHSDIGSEVALKLYQKLLLFCYERGWCLMSGLGYAHRNPEDCFHFYRALWEKRFIHWRLNSSV